MVPAGGVNPISVSKSAATDGCPISQLFACKVTLAPDAVLPLYTKMRWLVLVPIAVVADASELNGLDKFPFPFEPAAGFTNQITGAARVKVTVAGALQRLGVGLPLSHTV